MIDLDRFDKLDYACLIAIARNQIRDLLEFQCSKYDTI